MAIFPEHLNKEGLERIDKDALKAALDAHGVTVEPLLRIFERVYRAEYAQRRADIDIICGQPLDLEARVKAIRKGKPAEKVKRKAEARKRASGRHKPKAKPKPKAKAARSARVQRAAPPVEDPGMESEAEDAEDDDGYATEEDAAASAPTVAEDAAEDDGWCLALLNAEAALLPPAECAAMLRLVESLELRPLFDTRIVGVKAPDFATPPFLGKRGREAELLQQQAAALALVASELAGARVMGFEMMYAPQGAAPRVLFACIGELLALPDWDGTSRNANLSYAEGNRKVLPDDTPRSVPSAIFRACMLTLAAKLLRGGATHLWLTACSPEWVWCKDTRKIYPDNFLVANRGRDYGIDVPKCAKPAQVKAMMLEAKEAADEVLVQYVYPKLFAHGERHGLLAPGSGKWVATPGAGAAVPPFVDELFSKRLLFPSAHDHAPAPEGALQQSFMDAELAESNKHAQMFWARLKQPEALSQLAAQLALRLDRKIPEPLAKHYRWRAAEFESIKNRALNQAALPKGFQTLGQLARCRVRNKYLEMQTNPLNF